jgi:hypothetical protein
MNDRSVLLVRPGLGRTSSDSGLSDAASPCAVRESLLQAKVVRKSGGDRVQIGVRKGSRSGSSVQMEGVFCRCPSEAAGRAGHFSDRDRTPKKRACRCSITRLCPSSSATETHGIRVGIGLVFVAVPFVGPASLAVRRAPAQRCGVEQRSRFHRRCRRIRDHPHTPSRAHTCGWSRTAGALSPNKKPERGHSPASQASMTKTKSELQTRGGR